MRGVFGIVGLLLVVAVVGLLAKKQISSVNDIKVPVPGVAAPAVNPAGNVQQQSQQIQQQFKAAAEAAVQQPRPEPETK